MPPRSAVPSGGGPFAAGNLGASFWRTASEMTFDRPGTLGGVIVLVVLIAGGSLLASAGVTSATRCPTSSRRERSSSRRRGVSLWQVGRSVLTSTSSRASNSRTARRPRPGRAISGRPSDGDRPGTHGRAGEFAGARPPERQGFGHEGTDPLPGRGAARAVAQRLRLRADRPDRRRCRARGILREGLMLILVLLGPGHSRKVAETAEI